MANLEAEAERAFRRLQHRLLDDKFFLDVARITAPVQNDDDPINPLTRALRRASTTAFENFLSARMQMTEEAEKKGELVWIYMLKKFPATNIRVRQRHEFVNFWKFLQERNNFLRAIIKLKKADKLTKWIGTARKAITLLKVDRESATKAEDLLRIIHRGFTFTTITEIKGELRRFSIRGKFFSSAETIKFDNFFRTTAVGLRVPSILLHDAAKDIKDMDKVDLQDQALDAGLLEDMFLKFKTMDIFAQDNPQFGMKRRRFQLGEERDIKRQRTGEFEFADV
jgi:hypothetical protein